MNAPFTSNGIEAIHANACVSISGLKRNPAAVIAAAQEQQIAILNRNKPVAYLISPAVWEAVADLVDDAELASIVRDRLAANEAAIRVSIDEL